MERQKYIKFFASLGILLLGVVFLILPSLIRTENTFIGDKPYYHLRLGDNLKDGLSFSGRENVNGVGWNFILSYIPLKIILFGMGLTCILLFYLNLKRLNFEEKALATGFFILSPAFLYMFNAGERFGISFIFTLITALFLTRKKYVLSGLSTLIIFSFDYWVGAFVLFSGIIYVLYKYKKKLIITALILLFLVFIFAFGSKDAGFISDLGAKVGVSVFGLLFAMFSFFLFWNNRRLLLLYGVSVLLFLLSLRFEFGVFYFSTALSALIALCFMELLKMKWSSKLIRDLTLFLIVCGLLFSGLSYVNRLGKSMPNDELFMALDNIPKGTIVFSDIEYGNWISYKGMMNLWDSFTNVPGFEKREKELNEIINSKDYGITSWLMDKYGINYILIDQNLKEKWGEDGLLYLLKYNDRDFKLIYEKDGIEVWRYVT